MYMCPVCGYDRLSEPPADFTICPCCATEFEYDDVIRSREDLRASWLRSGAKWWSSVDNPPNGWDPYAQLNRIIKPTRRGTVLIAPPLPTWLRMLAGAETTRYRMPSWDLMINRAHQTILVELKSPFSDMTFQEMARLSVRTEAEDRQSVSAFNPETEGWMPQAA